MQMTPLACSWPSAGDCDDGNVLDLYGLFEQAVEEQAALAGAAAVEAERELVEVEVELLRADRALVRAEQPALQQRGNAVGARHDDMGRIAAGRNARLLMDEPGAGESAVALPVIGVDYRAGLHRSADEVGEHTSGAVRDAGKPDPATRPARTRLDRDRDDRPVDKRPAPESARPGRADRCLVDFDLAGELVTPWAHYCPAQLVQQRPRGPVAAEAEQPLQAERAHAVLRAGHVPGGGKPGRQRQPPISEDRSRRHRLIGAAARTEIPTLAHPPRPLAAADGAAKSILPTQPSQVAQARLIIDKPRIELTQRARIITAGKRELHSGQNRSRTRRNPHKGASRAYPTPLIWVLTGERLANGTGRFRPENGPFTACGGQIQS